MLLTNLANSAHEKMWVTYQVNRVPSDAAKCVDRVIYHYSRRHLVLLPAS